MLRLSFATQTTMRLPAAFLPKIKPQFTNCQQLLLMQPATSTLTTNQLEQLLDSNHLVVQELLEQMTRLGLRKTYCVGFLQE